MNSIQSQVHELTVYLQAQREGRAMCWTDQALELLAESCDDNDGLYCQVVNKCETIAHSGTVRLAHVRVVLRRMKIL